MLLHNEWCYKANGNSTPTSLAEKIYFIMISFIAELSISELFLKQYLYIF